MNPSDKHHFVIIYEEGGRLYTYRMTVDEMQTMLTDRGTLRDPPWRVWVVIDGEMTKVDVHFS